MNTYTRVTSAQNNRNIRLECFIKIMLLQKYCNSISAVYAAAAAAIQLLLPQLRLPSPSNCCYHSCGCRRCKKNSATAADCCSCNHPLLPTVYCLLTAAAASRRSRCRKELCIPLQREAHSEPDSLQNYLSLWSNNAKPNACDSVTTAALCVCVCVCMYVCVCIIISFCIMITSL